MKCQQEVLLRQVNRGIQDRAHLGLSTERPCSAARPRNRAWVRSSSCRIVNVAMSTHLLTAMLETS